MNYGFLRHTRSLDILIYKWLNIDLLNFIKLQASAEMFSFPRRPNWLSAQNSVLSNKKLKPSKGFTPSKPVIALLSEQYMERYMLSLNNFYWLVI